jgi:hypothetical protein
VLVAVADDEFAKGLRPPGEPDKQGNTTHDWREPALSPKNRAGVVAVYRVMPIEAALDRVYRTGAHMVGYVLHGPDGTPEEVQPRITKSALPWLYAQGYSVMTHTLLADWDNPHHADWTQGHAELVEQLRARTKTLATAAYYDTRRGQRIVQPLRRPIHAMLTERGIRHWYLGALAEGVEIDRACLDWTRNMRMNKAVDRHGKQMHYEPLNVGGMRGIDIEPWLRAPRFDDELLAQFGTHGRNAIAACAAEHGWAEDEAAQTKRVRRMAGSVRSVALDELPESFRARAVALGEACGEVAKTTRHVFWRHISGALCHQRVKVPIEYVPAIVHVAADAAGHDGKHHRKTALDTAQEWARGGAVTGWPRICRDYPHMVEALMAFGLRGNGVRHVAPVAEKPSGPTFAAVQQMMFDAIDGALPGITVIQAPCGAGKTYTAARVAAARFDKKALNDKVRQDWKTGIAVDKHTLSVQTVAEVAQFHVPAKRLFSPHTLKDASGKHVCVYHEQGEALAAGGQSMRHLLCDGGVTKKPCPHAEGCAAREGVEGPTNAAVVVGTHAKLAHIASAIGTSSLLIVDELTALLERDELKLDDFATTLTWLDSFDSYYAAAMRPLVELVRGWLADAEEGNERPSLREICEVGGVYVKHHSIAAARATTRPDESGDVGLDALTCAQLAIKDGVKAIAPPIRGTEVHRMRAQAALAKNLGTASRVLFALYQAALGVRAEDYRPMLRVEERDARKTLTVLYPDATIRAVLGAFDRVVVLDANADLTVPKIEAIMGREIRVVKLGMADAAPVSRTVWETKSASRGRWLVGKRPAWDDGLKRELARVGAWLAEDPTCTAACIVTYRPIALAIEATWSDRAAPVEAWLELGNTMPELQRAREIVRETLHAYKGELVVGYYGGVRGMNNAAHCTAIVTLGDPRPNVDAVEVEAKYLGFEPEGYVDRMAAAELEQAQGRLRVHTRTTAARALHLGCVVPGGNGWDAAAIVAQEATPWVTHLDGSTIVARRKELGLTQRQLAQQTGVAVRTVRRYEETGSSSAEFCRIFSGL